MAMRRAGPWPSTLVGVVVPMGPQGANAQEPASIDIQSRSLGAPEGVVSMDPKTVNAQEPTSIQFESRSRGAVPPEDAVSMGPESANAQEPTSIHSRSPDAPEGPITDHDSFEWLARKLNVFGRASAKSQNFGGLDTAFTYAYVVCAVSLFIAVVVYEVTP